VQVLYKYLLLLEYCPEISTHVDIPWVKHITSTRGNGVTGNTNSDILYAAADVYI
jgi:hypothetical protein